MHQNAREREQQTRLKTVNIISVRFKNLVGVFVY